MGVFEHSDYRDIINEHLEHGAEGSWGKRTELAKALNIHSSQLSQVMAGTRSLTPDQGLALSRLMGLTELETEYLLQLIHLDRAGTNDFKKFTEQKLKDIKAKALKAAERYTHQKQLSESHRAQFYSHYLYSAIRLYCSTDPKGRTVDEIKNRFQLPRDRLIPILDFLVETGTLIEVNKSYQMGVANTFLPRESPHIHRHHANWRVLAVQYSPRLDDEELMFTAPMSISKKDFEEIREDLMKKISSLSEKIKNSPAEEVACLNVDFFWVRS